MQHLESMEELLFSWQKGKKEGELYFLNFQSANLLHSTTFDPLYTCPEADKALSGNCGRYSEVRPEICMTLQQMGLRSGRRRDCPRPRSFT